MALLGRDVFTEDHRVIVAERIVCAAGHVFVAVVLFALLLAGCGIDPGAGPSIKSPEADAIFYLAVRDEALDAEVLWTGVHDDIKAETSRSEFVDCVYERAGRTGPAAPASTQDRGFEREAGPIVSDVAMNGAKVASSTVLEREGITYSVADRRDDRGIISVDVEVEGPQSSYVTTVLLAYGVDDPHWSDARYTPEDLGLAASFPVVGTVPEDPCLFGAEAVREHLQATGMISVGGGSDGQLSDLTGHRVLAVVWDGAPEDLNMVGGAFWWIDDGGGDGVHPPNEGDRDAPREGEDDPDRSEGDEPRSLDWVERAFLPTDIVRADTGRYTVEVWANPAELTPSANPYLPADTAERHCILEVEVTPGTRLDVILNDIPTDGSECPHETQYFFGF